MNVDLNEKQISWVNMAVYANKMHRDYEECLGRYVRGALSDGVPLNTLAKRLGVSRSRVRLLAREPRREE